MATNKNQHYVPQCYLRQFASDISGASINIFNVDRKKFIECAPIKNQCSKSYFYGKNLNLERALQPIEANYALLIKRISHPNYCLTDEDGSFLKRFWLLQYMRTEAASIRSIEIQEEMGEIAGVPPEVYKIKLKEAVYNSMKIYVESIDIIDDLSLCLIKNKTSIEFITSDDPAVLTNKWNLRDGKANVMSFGLGSAGNLIMLPLTPKILCLGYDKHVYSLSKKNGWLDVRNEKDIQSFNEHQLLNCRANVYTQDNGSEEMLLKCFSVMEKNKPDSRHKINYAVLDEVLDGYKSYKAVDRDKAGNHEEAIMHCQSIYAVPTSWPSQIRRRNNAFVFTNGSGIGYVRRSQVKKMPNEDFHKEYIQRI
jgi:hypothetical protein